MRLREAERRTAESSKGGQVSNDELLMSLRSTLLNNKIDRIP